MRTHALPLSATLLGVLLLSPTAPAQDLVAPGFALTAQQPVPVQGAAYRTLSSGERVVFDGLTVDLYDAAGQFLANLGSLPGFVFPSFVALSPDESIALVGESSNGDLFRVDLGGAGMAFVANLSFNYDAVFLDATSAVVSAATCGFGCGNDLVRVNVVSGATQDLVDVPGASGPVALASNGDLHYATVSGTFPPPPGSSQVLRWSAAQVGSGAPLTVFDAEVVVTGLDGAASMAVDPVLGGILVAESAFGGTSRIRLFSAGGGAVSGVIESPDYLSTVELLPGGGAGHFHPYQPSTGIYMTYSSGSEIRTIRARRPSASFTQSGSTGTLKVTGAPANGGMLVVWGSSALWSPQESAYHLSSFGFLLHTGLPPSQLRRMPFLVPIDAGGTALFHYFDPGNLAGTLVFQGLVMDASGQFLGLSTSAAN